MNRPNYITEEALKVFIDNALAEDIRDGDHSTLATIPEDLEQQAKLLVKEDCILAGVEMARIIFHEFDSEMKVETFLEDGQPAKKGEVAFVVTGKARSILSTERLVLNCMQRMSGIATLTNDWSTQLEGTSVKLLDTRKTTPNFRICEKWAVAIGGGNNHRYGLYDMIMLKDNHIDYNGSIAKAVKMAKDYVNHNQLDIKIEVETRNLDEVQQAIATQMVDRIMLDNMDVETMKKAVDMIGGASETEASGGITKEVLGAVATTGVDYISAGALTHSARNIDLSLKAIHSNL